MSRNIDWQRRSDFKMMNALNSTIGTLYQSWHARQRLEERFPETDMPSQSTETIQFPRRGGTVGYMSRCGDKCVVWTMHDGSSIVTIVPINHQYERCKYIAHANGANMNKVTITFGKRA